MTEGAQVLAIRHAATSTRGMCSGDAEVDCCVSPEDAARTMLDEISTTRCCQVWSSPLSRCLAPARIVARTLRIPLTVDDRLREISFGAWQGLSWTSIEATDGERYRHWLDNWEHVAPPDGESPEHLVHRIHTWWMQLRPDTHVLIAHAGVIRALRVLVHGSSWPDAMQAPAPHLKREWFRKPEFDRRGG